MTELTTTVKVDRTDPPDFAYETDITSKVLDAHIKTGRSNDASTARIGTCSFKLNNAVGTYTPKAGGSAIRPLQPVQVIVESQNLFTGFVRRPFLDPRGDEKVMTVDCADWLWVLSRKDISRPLMRDVRSDNLAHRIVDLAEIGEHIDNTRFRDDLTGYAVFGVSTNTRVTTGIILEGAASMESVANAFGGWKYTVPHTADADFQSRKVTASGYFWASSEADVGESVRLNISDSDSAQRAATDLVLSLEPQYVTVTATFGAAATEFYVGGQMTTPGTFRTGAVHLVYYESAIPRDFDVGQSVFQYVGPRRLKALSALREVANDEFGYVYINGSGILMFEDKNHRWRETESLESQGTLDETMVAMPYEENADDLIGEVELGFAKWEIGDPDTVVWGLFPVPRSIPPNGSLTIDIDYGAIVRDPTTPVANIDYIITDAASVDATGDVSLDFDDYGGGARAVFTDSGGVPLTLDSFQIRATPVRVSSDSAQVTYEPASPPAVAAKLRYSYRLQSSEPYVQALAEYLGDKYVTQQPRLPPVLVNNGAALVTEMTERVISDRVTLMNDNKDYSAKVNGDFYIDNIEHRLDMGKTWMETRWGCVPADVEYFGLDDVDIGLDDAVNYPLSP